MTALTSLLFALTLSSSHLTEYQIYVHNSTREEVWKSPIGIYDGLGGLRPPFWREYTLNPKETIDIPYATAKWNFTGIHIIHPCAGCEGVIAAYNDVPVLEGTYTIEWRPGYSTNYAREGCCEIYLGSRTEP